MLSSSSLSPQSLPRVPDLIYKSPHPSSHRYSHLSLILYLGGFPPLLQSPGAMDKGTAGSLRDLVPALAGVWGALGCPV